MIVLQLTVMALNLLVALVFGIDYFVAESREVAPKTKAGMGVLLASLFFAFLVSLTLFAALSAVLNRNARCLALLIYVAIPFVIGRLVSYRTLRVYTTLQVLALIFSMATLCFMW